MAIRLLQEKLEAENDTVRLVSSKVRVLHLQPVTCDRAAAVMSWWRLSPVL